MGSEAYRPAFLAFHFALEGIEGIDTVACRMNLDGFHHVLVKVFAFIFCLDKTIGFYEDMRIFIKHRLQVTCLTISKNILPMCVVLFLPFFIKAITFFNINISFFRI
jgi:hypothetical protein